MGLAPFGPMVSGDVKDMVAAKRAAIESGKWDVFTGPIKNQAGEVVVADGVRMEDGAMLGMSFFVEGVVGQIPK